MSSTRTGGAPRRGMLGAAIAISLGIAALGTGLSFASERQTAVPAAASSANAQQPCNPQQGNAANNGANKSGKNNAGAMGNANGAMGNANGMQANNGAMGNGHAKKAMQHNGAGAVDPSASASPSGAANGGQVCNPCNNAAMGNGMQAHNNNGMQANNGNGVVGNGMMGNGNAKKAMQHNGAGAVDPSASASPSGAANGGQVCNPCNNAAMGNGTGHNNGMQAHNNNGMQANNGMANNGMGHNNNGMQANNGMANNGMANNGMANNGMGHNNNGMQAHNNGMANNGMANNGMANAGNGQSCQASASASLSGR